MTMQYVITGTPDEYREFLRRYDLNKSEFCDVIFALQVVGLDPGTPIILYGTYRSRANWQQMRKVLLKRNYILIRWENYAPAKPVTPDYFPPAPKKIRWRKYTESDPPTVEWQEYAASYYRQYVINAAKEIFSDEFPVRKE